MKNLFLILSALLLALFYVSCSSNGNDSESDPNANVKGYFTTDLSEAPDELNWLVLEID